METRHALFPLSTSAPYEGTIKANYRLFGFFLLCRSGISSLFWLPLWHSSHSPQVSRLCVCKHFCLLYCALSGFNCHHHKHDGRRITSVFIFQFTHKVCAVLACTWVQGTDGVRAHRMVVDDCDSAGSWNVTALMKVLPFGRVCVWSRPAGRANWQICFCDHVNELLPVTVWGPFQF